MLEFIVLVFNYGSAAASIGVFQESPQTVILEIRYQNPVAAKVDLVWGVNGWTLAPEGGRPTGTLVEENIMHTPMLNEGGTFVARLQVVPGTVVDFGFLTTRDSRGNEVKIWEANGSADYQVMVNHNTVQKVQSQLALKTSRDLPSILVVGFYILTGVLVTLMVGFVFRRSPG